MESNGQTQGFTTLAYENIQIAPFEIIELNDFRIENKFNDHARVFFTGVISEKTKDKYIETTTCKTHMEVKTVTVLNGVSNTKSLFKGIVTRIKVTSVRDIYYLEVEGISNTYELDTKKRSISFQNNAMPYSKMIKKIIRQYNGADFIDTVSNGKKLGSFILQYNETDWEFLKRMASHFKSGLVADMNSDKPKFWFGVRQGEDKGALEDFNYEKIKMLSDYRERSENFWDQGEQNFVFYKTQSVKVCNIGDKVLFKGLNLVVSELNIYIEQGHVKCEYFIGDKDSLRINPAINKEIKGLSLEGKVIDVKSDTVKIHLLIDKEQKKEEATWFQCSTLYTAEGQTGWYSMPEVDDMVKLYFPEESEKTGIIMCSIRRRVKGGDKILQPEVKYYRTKAGKEIMFSKEFILITAKDGEVVIRLDEKNGILIQSKSDTQIISNDNLTVNAKGNIGFSAKDEIKFGCKESGLILNGVTTLKGTVVKIN